VLLLIGTLPAPISAAPLVILIYVVLVLMIASALATVILQDTTYTIGAFAATLLLVALLYLTVAPLLLFAVQLLIFTLVSALLLVGLLRTTGFERTAVGPFSREWIAGGAISAAALAVLVVVSVATSWPVRICCSAVEDFGTTLTNAYVVGLVTIVILLASAALGAGVMLRSAPTLPSPRGGGKKPEGGGQRRR
jgi:NADH:ubiquinone oxidoreductase subunit 6 (subunit J)